MRTLFVRIAAILSLTLVVGLVLLVYVGVTSYTEQLLRRHAQETARAHAVLVRDLRSTRESDWPPLIERVQELMDYRIDVIDPIGGESPPIIEHTGSTFSYDDVQALHAIGDGDPRWIRYARTYDSRLANEDVLLLALLFIALPVVLYLTLRPIAGKITDLSRVARAYADGRLDERSTLPAPRPLEALADNVHGMAQALKRKIEEQRVMTHAISHELKTPLTRMRTASDLALREDSPEAWKRYLDEADEDLSMLEKIMAETLTLSRLTFQNAPLEIGAVSLPGLIQDCLNECAAGDLSVGVDVPPGSTVLANRDAVRRVFANLLVNAVRFARHAIRIRSRLDGDRWVTAVEDDGPGIRPQDRDKVFMPFGRTGKSRSRATGDTGMGLAIASALVDKCDGEIWVDDSPTGGARFHVALPAAASTPSPDTR